MNASLKRNLHPAWLKIIESRQPDAVSTAAPAAVPPANAALSYLIAMKQETSTVALQAGRSFHRQEAQRQLKGLADVMLRLGELKLELENLPAQRKEARQAFVGARATVVEMELEEKLQEFLPMIARATAARAISTSQSLPRGYEVRLPQVLMETTRARLEAEVPG